ncbi:MAG: LysR family transcriptional regulator [Clostridia bacterium]|nr:LysR family transcriptional regulator [Clostridia bacterium]
MVNLELYKIFKIVADEENLTRASEILNISQPAVTKHIHNLENELQIKLFDRTRYGMTLTPDGEKIYAQVKDAIQTLISVESNLKQTEILNLGIHTNMPKEIYRALISIIKQKNPNMEVNIEKAPTEEMFSMLEKQKIDAYFSKKQPDEIHSESMKFIKLGNFHDNFFVNSNSKYKGKNILKNDDKVTIYTLRNISSTSRNLENILKEKKLKNTKIKNATFNTIIEEMQNNDIIAYITEEYIQEELKNGKLSKLPIDVQTPEIEYGIYYNSNNKIKNIKRLFNGLN